MLWPLWRKIVFLIHILKVYNPRKIKNKERIRKYSIKYPHKSDYIQKYTHEAIHTLNYMLQL